MRNRETDTGRFGGFRSSAFDAEAACGRTRGAAIARWRQWKRVDDRGRRTPEGFRRNVKEARVCERISSKHVLKCWSPIADEADGFWCYFNPIITSSFVMVLARTHFKSSRWWRIICLPSIWILYMHIIVIYLNIKYINFYFYIDNI